MERGELAHEEIQIEARSPSGWQGWAYPDPGGNFELSGMPDEEVSIRVQWTADYQEQETTHQARAGAINVRITLRAPESATAKPAAED